MPVEPRTGEPLPSWASILAGQTPRMAAGLLHLDFVHRAHSPLDPKLRAEMRWVAAHANHCAYAEAYALADARRAGLDDAGIDALRHADYSKLPAAEKVTRSTSARKMTAQLLLGHRRRVRHAGQGVQREEQRGDGHVDGLLELSGPIPPLPSPLPLWSPRARYHRLTPF